MTVKINTFYYSLFFNYFGTFFNLVISILITKFLGPEYFAIIALSIQIVLILTNTSLYGSRDLFYKLTKTFSVKTESQNLFNENISISLIILVFLSLSLYVLLFFFNWPFELDRSSFYILLI